MSWGPLWMILIMTFRGAITEHPVCAIHQPRASGTPICEGDYVTPYLEGRKQASRVQVIFLPTAHSMWQIRDLASCQATEPQQIWDL